MKATLKRKSNSTAGAAQRRRCGMVVRFVKNKATGKKKLLAASWSNLTGADVNLIVRQINNPPRPSSAMQEAEVVYQTILQLD